MLVVPLGWEESKTARSGTDEAHWGCVRLAGPLSRPSATLSSETSRFCYLIFPGPSAVAYSILVTDVIGRSQWEQMRRYAPSPVTLSHVGICSAELLPDDAPLRGTN